MGQAWAQVYDPLGSPLGSTLFAALPIIVLLGALALLRIKAHWAAIAGLLTAIAVAVGPFGMPPPKLAAAALLGAAYGLLPIGWIIVNVIFLYMLTEQRGLFAILKESLTGLTRDARLQLLLVAFCFGAFFEGAAGFGTPVAVTAAMLIGLGFHPLQASGLSLIANTAPVAFGALGTPVIALHGVTGFDLRALSAMIGRQLPLFSLVVPFWLVWAYAGFRGMLAVWPALLVAGLGFAVPQFVISNFHGPWLVDVIASVTSMACLALFLRSWKGNGANDMRDHEPMPTGRSRSRSLSLSISPSPPLPLTRSPALDAVPVGGGVAVAEAPSAPIAQIGRAWLPWIILTIFVFLWGIPQFKAALDQISTARIAVPGLHGLILRMPPVVAEPKPEDAVFALNWLSATGTGILFAAVVAGLAMGYSARELLRTYWATLRRVRLSLLTVAAMLSLGYVTRYAGLDATLGLAFARTGALYPFFGTLLGWLGVALTGSDTSSNVLFGSLQKISAAQVGVSPLLMAAANSAGGVMGKMIDAQSIVVASTATHYYGQEGRILRFVFFHSLALAALVGLLVLAQAYLWPFSGMVIR